MRNARFSVLVFGIYLLVVGVSLAVIPEQFLQVFGVAQPQEVWIKLVGMLTGIIGVYYLGAVFNNSTWMFRYTVFGRMIAIVFLIYLAVADGPWQLWIFAAIEALGALWTYASLRPRPEPVAESTASTE